VYHDSGTTTGEDPVLTSPRLDVAAVHLQTIRPRQVATVCAHSSWLKMDGCEEELEL
jgi:hypothetical protein